MIHRPVLALMTALFLGTLGAVAAEALVVYEFPSGVSAAVPDYPDDQAHCEATDAAWVVPDQPESLYGFGGRTSTAYLNNAAAPRHFDPEIYLTFTVTARPGYLLDLEELVLRFGGTTTEAYKGEPFPVHLRIFSDGQEPPFSRELPLGPEKVGEVAVQVTDVPSQTGAFETAVADLRGGEFKGRESVTFRIHLSCPSRASSIFLRLDQITVRGTTVRK